METGIVSSCRKGQKSFEDADQYVVEFSNGVESVNWSRRHGSTERINTGSTLTFERSPANYMRKGWSTEGGTTPNGSQGGSTNTQTARTTNRPSGDPRQQSIESQACMKTAMQGYCELVSNGQLQYTNIDDMVRWVSEATKKLHTSCLR